MENSNDAVCPTGTLIDLNEDYFVPSYLSDKLHTPSHSQRAMACIQNKGNESMPKQKKYKCIMDMSPSRLNCECNEPDINSFADSEQVLGTVTDDCPTALLIDVPNSSKTCSKQSSLLMCNKRNSQQKESLVQCSSNQDAKLKEYSCIGKKLDSAIEDSDNPCSYSPVENELSPPRIRWKTPSPQSMSCISKEASKVIYDLNSSALLDEDSLLCEEIMPVPLNFNLDENSDEETLITNPETCSGDSLLNQKSSVSIQTDQDIISSEISKTVLNSFSSDIKDTCISPNYNSLAQSSFENFDSKLEGKKDADKCSTTSESLQSSEIQSSSFDSSGIFISDGETNVFIENNLPSEDKENIQERRDKVLPSKAIIKGSKATSKNSVYLKETEKRPTLRNLSNIKNGNSRYIPKPSINKMNSTLNYNFAPNSKELQSQGKQQLKKTTSVEPQMQKRVSRANSLQFDSKRESVSSFQQPKSINLKPSSLSEYKSSSSDVKPSFTEMKTPNKRYSIATPLQNISIKKSSLTPALSRIQNPSVPRFTPQSASGNRLSFSKSWQQPNKSSSKGFKNQNTMRTFSPVEKSSFCRTVKNKQALNQSISLLPSQMSKGNSLSTTSKKRFCSKLNLPSPLPAEHDTKLARVLFPSKSFK